MSDIRINIETIIGDTKRKLEAVRRKIKSVEAPVKSLGRRVKDLGRRFKNLGFRMKGSTGGINAVSKSAKDASFNMFHMMKRSIALVAVLGLVFKAVELVGAGFRKAFDAVEKYAKQVAGLTALTLTFMKVKPGENLGQQYLRAKDYAKGLFSVIEDIAAVTLLTGQQATLMARTFLENGVAINFQNQEQIQGLKSIANALAIVTEGQAKERQIRSEINNLLKGRIRATESLGTLLKAINPKLLDQLKVWKQQGKVIENVAALLKGFDATTGDISVTWEAISTTISTTADRVLRGAFQPVYRDILDITLRINSWLEKNKDILQIEFMNAYSNIKTALSFIIEGWKISLKVIGEVVDITQEWVFWIGQGVETFLKSEFVEMWKEGARALGFTIASVEDLREKYNKFMSEARDKRLTIQLSKEGLNISEIEDGLANLPNKLKESLNPNEIKQLIKEGFTSGFLPVVNVLDVMVKRIVVGRERLDELGEAAKKAGVEFNTVQLTRIIKDIPTLEKVSAETFQKMVKGIREVTKAVEVDGITNIVKKFELDKDFAKLLIPEFNRVTDEADKALEKLFARVKSKMEKFALEVSGIGLRGDDKEEFKISQKFDKMILARKSFLEKERSVLEEKNPELLALLETQVKNETKIIQTEKDFQLDIYREFTSKIKSMQQIGVGLGVDIKTIGLQQELNKLTGDYAKSLNDTSELIKLESELRQNSLDIAILEAEKKRELGTLTIDQANLLIDALNRQKEVEGELAEIRAGNAEKMKTETGAFMLGLEEQINSFGDFNEQVKALGIEVADSLNNNFQTFFFDAMKGELKTAEDYWRSFSQSIMQMLSQILAKWLMMKALGAIGGGIATAHSGGLVMHDGGKVGDTSKLKRFHQGGLSSDERVAVLQTGERVLSRRQNRDFEDSGGSSSNPVIVNMNVSATDADSFNSRILQSKDAVANAMMSASSDNHRVRRG